MIALKLVLEGLGLGFLLYLICAIGIRNGAVGMVHLYLSIQHDQQELLSDNIRAVNLLLTGDSE